MAKVVKNSLLAALQGKIGDEIVIKQTKYGPVATKVPDMSNVVKSPNQKMHNAKFARATAYAKDINRDHEKREEYRKKIPEGASVYHEAFKEFMAKDELRFEDGVFGEPETKKRKKKC